MSILTLIVVSIIIILLLGVVNAQIFGRVPVSDECRRVGYSHFNTIENVSSTFPGCVTL